MNKLKSASFIFLSLFLVVIFSGCQNNTATNDFQKKGEAGNIKNDEKTEEMKYKEERLGALSLVQAYKIQKTINEGNSKFEVKLDTKLYDVFKLQKQSGYIDLDGRWVVVKDGERFVVIYRSNVGESLNNPQWSVINEDMKALNGTAIKYTPELGYQNPKLDTANFTKARKIYLRFMELGETAKYQKSLESSDANLRQKTEDEAMGIVAKEFEVSLIEANKMFFEGMQEGNDETKEVNNERGNILSDEKLVQLIKEQGDLYLPEN
ncbi:MAG: hypothetical protein WC678_04305 [Parcubacteria group bacterium]|jgi:hypothetical protein